MNSVIENMKSRRSIRSYKKEKITGQELDAILEAGLWAPSGMNRQAVKLVSVTDDETVEKLNRMNAKVLGGAAGNPFYGAPQVIVVFADSNVFTYIEDGSLAMGNMMNAAASLGVASCWIHRAREMFDSDEGRALAGKWGIPDSYKGIGNCILGYAAENPPVRERNSGRVIKI